MASRTRQKEEARARRIAEERERQERERRNRRLRMLGGTVVVVAALLGVGIALAIGSGGSGKTVNLNTPAARQAAASVNSLVAGIPQSGNRIGAPSAPVTVTEFADLECPVCKDFALNAEKQLIQNDIRAGKVKLIYRSSCTATCTNRHQNRFVPQQAAAAAAGLQNKQWNYALLFYNLQGDETANYANDAYLSGLASLLPGLNMAKWRSDRSSSTLSSQVSTDQQQAETNNFTSTPTLVVAGPKGQAAPLVGDVDYNTVESTIKSTQ